MQVYLNDGTYFDLFTEVVNVGDDGSPSLAASVCILGSHMGFVNIKYQLHQLALAHGYRPTNDLAQVTLSASTDELVDIGDAALAYLNTQIASVQIGTWAAGYRPSTDPDDYQFAWQDGEVFLANRVWFED